MHSTRLIRDQDHHGDITYLLQVHGILHYHSAAILLNKGVLHPLQSCLKAALLTKQSLDRLRSASSCSNFHTVQQLTSRGQ